MTLYELLNVPMSASADEIQTAYKTLAKKYHPDIYDGDKKFAEQQMIILNNAYEILSDPRKRAEYDQLLHKTQKTESKSENSTQGAVHENEPNNETQKNESMYVNENEIDNKKKTKRKVPFVFTWRFICLILFLSMFWESKTFFIISCIWLVIRLMISISQEEYRLKIIPRIFACVSCLWLLMAGVGMFFLGSDEYVTQTVNTENTSSSYDNTTNEDVMMVESETEKVIDDILLNDTTDLPNDTQRETEEKEPTGAVKPSDTAKVTNSDIEETNPPRENNQSYSPPEFDDLDVLDRENVKTVWYIANDRALVTTKDSDVVQYYDLKKEKDICSASSLYSDLSMDNGYLYYTNIDSNWNTDVHFLDNMGEDVLQNIDLDNIAVIDINYDRQTIVAKREVYSLEYSGHEYALMTFEGEQLTDWIREPTNNEIAGYDDLGDGMYYAGSEYDDSGNIITDYLIDMYSGEIFTWPIIHSTSGTELDYNDIVNGEFHDCQVINETCSMHGIRDFIGDSCVVYYNNYDSIDFFNIYRDGSYSLISSISSIPEMIEKNANDFSGCIYSNSIKYIDDLKMYICVSESKHHNSYYYNDLIFHNMYGQKILNMSDKDIISYELGEKYIIIKQENQTGSITRHFYSIYDYHGNRIHEPFCIDGDDMDILESISCYAFYDKDGLRIYDMDDNLVHTIKTLELKEQYLLWKKERTYYPINITIYDDYYVVEYKEYDDYNIKSLIGKINYQSENLYENYNEIHKDVYQNYFDLNNKEYTEACCGKDYYGNELYIGSPVRIDINKDTYAIGTITGYVRFGYVHVEFTDVYSAGEYTAITDYNIINDIYYGESIREDIHKFGKTNRSVNTKNLVILVFG